MTCILSHYARCFCVRALGKDIDFVPLGAVYLVLGCTCNTNAYGLGMGGLVMGCSRTWTPLLFRHGCSGNGMLSNMNVIMVWAGMLWQWDVLENDAVFLREGSRNTAFHRLRWLLLKRT